MSEGVREEILEDLSPIFKTIQNALFKSCLSGYVEANAKMIELISTLLKTEEQNNKVKKFFNP